MSPEQRRLVAIMFTDVVGYTAMGQRNESLSLALVDEQRKMIRPILNRHNGKEVKTMGDAFLIDFPSALDAVRCAYDIQRAVREFNIALPLDRRLHLRIGLHLGDVVESAGDISGDAVNVASRIEPLAEDGGVCLTRQVYDHVQNKFEVPFASLGSRSLSGVSVPFEVFRMVMPWEAERTPPPTQLNRKRIVILPFTNLSPDPVDAYFADGVTEELITSLSGLSGLTVIARTSVMKYKSSPKGASEIGRELNVGTLIEGSVRKAGNRVRITVQLVDAATEGHVWAKNYDKQLDDIFAIQSEIAERVTEELRVRLLDSEKRRLEVRPTEITQAYTSYLRARYHWNSRSEAGLKIAIRYFEEAIAIDPGYTLALVGLADTYSVSAIFGYLRPKTAYSKAKELAQRALDASPDLAEAHASMGEILMQSSYDWGAAAGELGRAIEIDPDYATAHLWMCTWYAVLGRLEEALAEARRALELDPFAVVVMNEVGKTLYYAGMYDEATKEFVRSLEIEPGSAYLHKGLAETYIQTSKFGDAVREIEKALALSRTPYILDGAAAVYGLAAQQDKAREVLEELDELAKSKFVPFYGRAAAYAALGRKEKALQLLENAFDEHSWLVWLNVDPLFDSLRNEQAFRSLVRRMNLESPPNADGP